MYSYTLHTEAAGTSDVGIYLPATPHQIQGRESILHF